jgi:hypothetical protein
MTGDHNPPTLLPGLPSIRLPHEKRVDIGVAVSEDGTRCATVAYDADGVTFNITEAINSTFLNNDPSNRLQAMHMALLALVHRSEDSLPFVEKLALMHLVTMLDDGLQGNLTDPCWPQNWQTGTRKKSGPKKPISRIEAEHALMLLAKTYRRLDPTLSREQSCEAAASDAIKGLKQYNTSVDQCLGKSSRTLSARIIDWLDGRPDEADTILDPVAHSKMPPDNAVAILRYRAVISLLKASRKAD